VHRLDVPCAPGLQGRGRCIHVARWIGAAGSNQISTGTGTGAGSHQHAAGTYAASGAQPGMRAAEVGHGAMEAGQAPRFPAPTHPPTHPPTSLNASAAACILDTCCSLRSRVGPTRDLAWKPLHRWLGRCFSCIGIHRQTDRPSHSEWWLGAAGNAGKRATNPLQRWQHDCPNSHSIAPNSVIQWKCNSDSNATPTPHPELLLLCGELAQEPNLLHLELPIQHQPPDACRRVADAAADGPIGFG
jgi:hypothetical protein